MSIYWVNPHIRIQTDKDGNRVEVPVKGHWVEKKDESK